MAHRGFDAVVLGAGPAGLGAALRLTRDGARVAVVDAGDRVGGLCRTLRRDGVAYDIGGHILFVGDEGRRRWLADLLGDGAHWVDRPVACVRDGAIVPGRYLDQRPDGPVVVNGAGPSAEDMLGEAFGRPFVDRVMRPYLEKVDGMPLREITAARAQKLLVEQAAPSGFWYAAEGIGQLMDAMASRIAAEGGEIRLATRVTGIGVVAGRATHVTLDAGGEPRRLVAGDVIAALPAGAVARLVTPGPPADAVPGLRPRAAAIVYLGVAGGPLSREPWIQVDDPRVPFARLAEVGNWSPALVPPGRTVLACECYCHPVAGDPVWDADDAALGRACAAALHAPLGLLAEPAAATLLEVVRLPRAWSLVGVGDTEAAMAPARWLDGVEGLHVAQGGDVIRAIRAGEDVAAALG